MLDIDAADEVAPGRFRVVVDEAWTVVHVHGGVLAALAARMAERGCPGEDMFVTGVAATFLRPVPAGLVDGAVTWLRSGRAAAQASVDLAGPDGELAVRVNVVLASRGRNSAEAITRARPVDELDVDGSEALGPIVAESADTMPFQRQHTWLRATPAGLDQGSEGDHRRSYDSWFRLHETPRTTGGLIDPLLSCLAADAIGLAATEALGLWNGERRFVLPTLSMDVQITGTPSSPWLLQHAEIHHLADGLVLGTVHLFDEADQLVAFASQRATVRFL